MKKEDKREQWPLVSIVLPVYNRPSVVRTIDSILKQTYKHFELIVVDNASTDDTVSCIKRLQDARIHLYINEKNRGQTYSINRGLELASGKYIARIDSDDIAFPDRIEKQVDFLEKNPEYVLCGSWVRFISDNDEPGFVVKMCTTDKGLRLMQTVACGMYHPTAMYRKNVIDKYKIRYNTDLSMAEDYDMWAQLLKYGRGLNLPEPLIYYRRGSNNDSRIYQETMAAESQMVRERICMNLKIDAFDKSRLIHEIKLEEKKNKSLYETIKIYLFYDKYIRTYISTESPDYSILLQHMLLKVYGSCISNNDRIYARIARNIYTQLKKWKK